MVPQAVNPRRRYQGREPGQELVGREEEEQRSPARTLHPVDATLNGRGTWYRVRLGRFSNQEDATRAKVVLAQAEIPAWVLRVE